jgi:hypothetical protein
MEAGALMQSQAGCRAFPFQETRAAYIKTPGKIGQNVGVLGGERATQHTGRPGKSRRRGSGSGGRTRNGQEIARIGRN